ncbi:hypothetical protein VTO42DRAFT_8416 [Malbranchea cinnamomea]
MPSNSTPQTPPEDVPLTIDDLVRSRAITNPNLPLVAYPSETGEYIDYTARQLDYYAYRLACHYATFIKPRAGSHEPTKVVGLLGPSNLTYLLSALALSKLGMTVLFLSTRLSGAAYMSLLNATSCKHLLVDEGLRSKTASLSSEMQDLNIHQIADFEKYRCETIDDNVDTSMDKDFDKLVESTNTAWIIHSSGSTGLPKPIYQTHSAALRNYAQNFNMRGFITLPLYHAHGLSSVFRSIYSKKQIHVYPSSLPLTGPNLLRALKMFDFEIFYGVPYALKLLSEMEDGLAMLRKLKIVMFGGSSCPDSLGDKLVRNGVPLISHYGTTETGQLMTSFREEGDLDWNYLRVSKTLQPFIRWEERGAGVYELVVLDGWPSKVATNREDGSYATKDLFVPHPTKPHCWKWIGRQDDTLVLLNGEKALPIMVEHALRQNPLVAEAVVFGAGRPQLGMFIIPAAETHGLSNDELLSRIMPTLDIANSEQPAFARISPEMIRILPHETIYPKTDKATVIRGAFYQQFKEAIDKVYEEFSEQSAGQENFTPEALLSFLRQTITSVMDLGSETHLDNDTDFFSLGMDSLQALRAHSAIVKTVNTNGARVSHNVVFEQPTLNALTSYLLALRDGESVSKLSSTEIMSQLLEKYSHFTPHTPGPLAGRGPAVLLTGATGSLGAHVISQLVRNPDVSKVYCLVRAASKQSAELRVLESLHRRKLSQHLRSAHQRKIIALPSDLSQPYLGLSQADYETLLDEVGLVIHLAWAVNFNLGVESFERHHIAGSHALIQLCLNSRRAVPAAFYFGSSVSAVVASAGVAEEKITADLSRAQSMGYAQSKLVTENICQRASQETGMVCKVLRIGQIVGDTQTGAWNDTEAIPLMIRSAITIGALPALDESPTWLPVDTVARTILEIVQSTSNAATPTPALFHIVNPCTFHWTSDLLPALQDAGLQFDIVGQRDWVSRLRLSKPDPVQNPPFKLLEFFASKYDRVEKHNPPYFQTDLACSFSPTLHGAPRLNASLVKKFVTYWQTECWNSQDQKATVLVVAGPCGSGKSTLSKAISSAFQVPQLDADSVHSAAAIEKMRSGQALTDEDRWAWLERVRRKFIGEATGQAGVVVACSALRRVYRDKLRDVPPDLRVRFLMLEADKAESLEFRLAQRQGHYMPAGLVKSQLETAEAAHADETDIICLDALQEKQDMIAKAVGIAEIFGLRKK